MSEIVNVPVGDTDLRQLRDGDAPARWRGFAPTQRMLDVFGYGPGDSEEAEYATTVIAGVDGLLRHGRRLVLAVETDDFETDTGPDADFGAVQVGRISWSDVRSIFADEASGRAAVAGLADDSGGDGAESPLAAAWASEGVQSLIETHDLLWFGPTEADQLLD